MTNGDKQATVQTNNSFSLSIFFSQFQTTGGLQELIGKPLFVSSKMAETSDHRGCSQCCFSFIFTSGLTALFMWLSLRTSNPTCSIQVFYVPALNKTANSPDNHSISFDLKLDNGNKDKGVFYDAINLTFYYGPNRTLSIANFSAPAFYQGHNKDTHRKAVVETYGVPWQAVSNGSEWVVFRVDLTTAVRFKIIFWKTKRHRLMVGSTVDVDNTGNKVKKKGIKLKSGAPELACYHARVGLLVIFSVLILVFT